MRYFGCHVSSSGGLANALKNGDELGVNTIQIHPSPPQKWISKNFPKDCEKAFLDQKKTSGVKKVFFHGIYLINLANPDPQKFHLSKTSLVHYLDLLARIDGQGVIFHVGSMKDQEDEAEGYKQIVSGVNWILEEAANNSTLLLEVAAGSGKVIGSRMEELARIYEKVALKERLGFALDTQHMWASGYNFQENLEEIISQVDSVLGLDKVHAIHLNDSKTECGSRKDRHENLGKGLIGEAALRAVINHPKLKNIPFILETPALKDMESAKIEVEVLRQMIKD